jgi:Flp pilus assembly CpaE family ATPase
MSGFVCPHCAECTNIFSSEGGQLLAKEVGVEFLGTIPIDPQLTSACENGKNFLELNPNSPSLQAVQRFVSRLIANENQPRANANQNAAVDAMEQ